MMQHAAHPVLGPDQSSQQPVTVHYARHDLCCSFSFPYRVRTLWFWQLLQLTVRCAIMGESAMHLQLLVVRAG
jgi:hypothetical protein